LKNTYGDGRSSPLALCAVKTNIGHLEGAAGMAGLLKAWTDGTDGGRWKEKVKLRWNPIKTIVIYSYIYHKP